MWQPLLTKKLICNLKNEITGYRGNTEVVPNFKDKALRRIVLDNGLQKKLRHKYFEELEMKLLDRQLDF